MQIAHRKTHYWGYKKLIAHTNIELKRLKSPFTFFASDKIKAINTALLKLEELSASFTAGEEKLKQAAYKQLARESGLIDALNMHRFSWSSKAKSHAPTKAIENMASGLLKAI
ncbi:hypothetical protein [Legionella fairfieldensis]|uniref:hypothetical protein n=1 Tax=Legionella fairfieldensis TaxID=45064 RepID=UPI000491B190|nr:hypothetical protein [Legionella fairfieldensis]